jgi:hypothetical protein
MDDRQKIEALLKRVVWDYNLDPVLLFRISSGENSPIGYFTKEKALARIFERLQWYDLIELYGINFIRDNLTAGVINKIHNQEIRRKYELVRDYLQGKAVSFPGWYSKTGKRFKPSSR